MLIPITPFATGSPKRLHGRGGRRNRRRRGREGSPRRGGNREGRPTYRWNRGDSPTGRGGGRRRPLHLGRRTRRNRVLCSGRRVGRWGANRRRRWRRRRRESPENLKRRHRPRSQILDEHRSRWSAVECGGRVWWKSQRKDSDKIMGQVLLIQPEVGQNRAWNLGHELNRDPVCERAILALADAPMDLRENMKTK